MFVCVCLVSSVAAHKVMGVRAVHGRMRMAVVRVNRPLAAIGSGEEVAVPVAWGWIATECDIAGVVLECGSGDFVFHVVGWLGWFVGALSYYSLNCQYSTSRFRHCQQKSSNKMNYFHFKFHHVGNK